MLYSMRINGEYLLHIQEAKQVKRDQVLVTS